LRSARRARKLTLRAVADATNLSHGYVADLEFGRRGATDEMLSRFAEALGIDPRALHRANATQKIERLEEQIAELKKVARS
jgi:transcriptional regulator with XRE-family HTH domain